MPATRSTLRRLFIALLAVLALVAVSCGDDDDDTTVSGSGDAPSGVEVTGAWARTSPMMADAGAAYLQLTSASGDRLLSASVDPSIAGTVEVHETVAVDSGDEDMAEDMSGDEDMTDDMAGEDHSEMDTAMTMRELTGGLELPAGETVSLEPGGYHIMMLELAAPLEAGSTFDLTLTFENAGEQVVSVEVRDSAP